MYSTKGWLVSFHLKAYMFLLKVVKIPLLKIIEHFAVFERTCSYIQNKGKILKVTSIYLMALQTSWIVFIESKSIFFESYSQYCLKANLLVKMKRSLKQLLKITNGCKTCFPNNRSCKCNCTLPRKISLSNHRLVAFYFNSVFRSWFFFKTAQEEEETQRKQKEKWCSFCLFIFLSLADLKREVHHKHKH